MGREGMCHLSSLFFSGKRGKEEEGWRQVRADRAGKNSLYGNGTRQQTHCKGRQGQANGLGQGGSGAGDKGTETSFSSFSLLSLSLCLCGEVFPFLLFLQSVQQRIAMLLGDAKAKPSRMPC